IGVAISRTLAAYGIENISLKWPNDILYENSKLAGILIETLAGIKHTQAVIGIGMNINNASMLESDLAIDNTSRLTTTNILLPRPFPKQFLINITNNINNIFDLNILLGSLITNILDILLIFEIQGLAPFVTEWQLKNYTLNKLVTIYNHNEQSITTGLNKGIDNNGALIIEKFDNINHKYELIKIYSGEVSVR
ncbi:MAG: biotin--[acetyl-CoA-carboxylase] ligase, partial [Gammaproteobacteria bacterium]